MNRLIFPLIFLALPGFVAGCDSPSPRMMGAAHRSVSVGGSRFGVHWSAGEAEVYRTSPEFLPRLSETRSKAGQAIVIATGCRVVPGTLAGDVALMRAEIDCG